MTEVEAITAALRELQRAGIRLRGSRPASVESGAKLTASATARGWVIAFTLDDPTDWAREDKGATPSRAILVEVYEPSGRVVLLPTS